MTHVLIAYTSKSGTTAEVADFMGNALREAGATVDVRPAKTVRDVNGYDMAFVGSGIRVGRWLGASVKFVEAQQAALAALPTAFFTVCLTLHEDTPENRAEVEAYLDPVRAILTPQAEGFFAGVSEPERLGFVERMALRAIKPPIGDFRDWDAIRAWTLDTYRQFVGAVAH